MSSNLPRYGMVCKIQERYVRRMPTRHCSTPWRQMTRKALEPEEALRLACEEQSIPLQSAEEEDTECWEDVLEDMEDFWMREPKASATDWEGEKVVAVETPQNRMETITVHEVQNASQVMGKKLLILDLNSTLQQLPSPLEVIQRQHLPLEQVTRSAAKTLQDLDCVVLYAESVSCAKQAYLRLAEVYGLSNVRVMTDPDLPVN